APPPARHPVGRGSRERRPRRRGSRSRWDRRTRGAGPDRRAHGPARPPRGARCTCAERALGTKPQEVNAMVEGSSSPAKRIESRPGVVIRFAGDSGDGMQVTGLQFTTESALAGNDLATLPDFPAEIRAPAGTLAGVSAFQLNFAAEPVFTPGDDLHVLVAMNPAALRVNLDALRPGGILMVDREAFNDANLRKAGYERNPLDDGSLDRWQLFAVDITKLT